MHANTLRLLLEELDGLTVDAAAEQIEDAVHQAEFQALKSVGQTPSEETK
jgi:hypothetical protein